MEEAVGLLCGRGMSCSECKVLLATCDALDASLSAVIQREEGLRSQLSAANSTNATLSVRNAGLAESSARAARLQRENEAQTARIAGLEARLRVALRDLAVAQQEAQHNTAAVAQYTRALLSVVLSVSRSCPTIGCVLSSKICRVLPVVRLLVAGRLPIGRRPRSVQRSRSRLTS